MFSSIKLSTQLKYNINRLEDRKLHEANDTNSAESSFPVKSPHVDYLTKSDIENPPEIDNVSASLEEKINLSEQKLVNRDPAANLRLQDEPATSSNSQTTTFESLEPKKPIHEQHIERHFESASNNNATESLLFDSVEAKKNLANFGEKIEIEDIEKVLYRASNTWSMTGLKLIENTVVLLKNGWAYTKLDSPLSELRIPVRTSTTIDDGWHYWRKEENGSTFLVDRKTGLESSIVGFELEPEYLNNPQIPSSFKKSASERWGDTIVTTWNGIAFDSDGNFQRSISTFSTSGGIGSLNDQSLVASFTSRSYRGSSSTNSIQSNINEFGSKIVTNSSKADNLPALNMVGTYKLLPKDMAIELSYADGRVVRELFYGTRNGIFFGNRSYLKDSVPHDNSTNSKDLLQIPRLEGADWLSVLAESSAEANRRQRRKIDVFLPIARSTDST